LNFTSSGGKHLGAQLGDDLAVDRNEARSDEIVGLAARAEARLREKTVQAHFADLLFGREFRVGRRFANPATSTATATSRAANMATSPPTVNVRSGIFSPCTRLSLNFTSSVGSTLVPSWVTIWPWTVTSKFGDKKYGDRKFGDKPYKPGPRKHDDKPASYPKFTPEKQVGEMRCALAIGGLVTVLAARFVAVAVLIAGFIAGLTLAVSRFVAELAARFVECRAIVRREMGIVGGPPTGPLAGRLLRIGRHHAANAGDARHAPP